MNGFISNWKNEIDQITSLQSDVSHLTQSSPAHVFCQAGRLKASHPSFATLLFSRSTQRTSLEARPSPHFALHCRKERSRNGTLLLKTSIIHDIYGESCSIPYREIKESMCKHNSRLNNILKIIRLVYQILHRHLWCTSSAVALYDTCTAQIFSFKF